MQDIISYLKDGILPEDKKSSTKNANTSQKIHTIRWYLIKERIYIFPAWVYKRGRSLVYDEEICGNHAIGHSLAQKALKQGYYLPNMRSDAMTFARKCEKCEMFTSISRKPI